jgi:hypothetical protein
MIRGNKRGALSVSALRSLKANGTTTPRHSLSFFGYARAVLKSFASATPNPAFNRTPRRRGFTPNPPAVAAGSRLTSSC